MLREASIRSHDRIGVFCVFQKISHDFGRSLHCTLRYKGIIRASPVFYTMEDTRKPKGGSRTLTAPIRHFFQICQQACFFERVIAKYGIHKSLRKWIFSGLLVNLLGDIVRPMREVLGYPFALLNLIRLKVKDIVAKKYFRQKSIYALFYFMLLLAALLILQKYHLAHFNLILPRVLF